jgi:hypothetical protein
MMGALVNSRLTNYHALPINFRRAFRHGFQGQISYTWSHTLDTMSNALEPFSYDSLTGQSNPASRRSLGYSSADYDIYSSLFKTVLLASARGWSSVPPRIIFSTIRISTIPMRTLQGMALA